ncbi:MAG: DUF4956 domain-containing protein [Bacteroidales bacterium]|nr:DUF4956 domain-containing protein [Bacteroidales bacterium]
MLTMFRMMQVAAEENIRFFGIKLLDLPDFLELVVRFSFNILVLVVLVRVLYYTITQRKDYLFTYLSIGTIVFLLCFLLENVKLQIGFALGLFAIFGIIRYRTNTIAIREMTYLFMVIGISVVNALANKKISYVELVFANVMVLTITYILEKRVLLRQLIRKTIIYENIELVKVGKEDELKRDLELRTGLKIERIEIVRIDYMRDIARLNIMYYAKSAQLSGYRYNDDDFDKNDDRI